MQQNLILWLFIRNGEEHTIFTGNFLQFLSLFFCFIYTNKIWKCTKAIFSPFVFLGLSQNCANRILLVCSAVCMSNFILALMCLAAWVCKYNRGGHQKSLQDEQALQNEQGEWSNNTSALVWPLLLKLGECDEESNWPFYFQLLRSSVLLSWLAVWFRGL